MSEDSSGVTFEVQGSNTFMKHEQMSKRIADIGEEILELKKEREFLLILNEELRKIEEESYKSNKEWMNGN